MHIKFINRLLFSKGIKNSLLFILILSAALLIISCQSPSKSSKNSIVVGIPNDVSTINPLYAFNIIEGHLIDLLFLKPFIEEWNDSLGVIEFTPMLADKWEWNSDSSNITLYLRDDIYWSDGEKITAEDIVFTFDIYSDPEVQSRFLGIFNSLYTLEDSRLDIAKTFEIISPQKLIINFKDGREPNLLDINLEILPKHIWSKYRRNEISSAKENFLPVTSGPFKLNKWERNSIIKLNIDSTSFLFNPENISEIVFKVLPDYRSRITNILSGGIDLLEGVKSEDIAEIKSKDNLLIKSLRGREYDYLGWNLIDPSTKEKSVPLNNKYFSSIEIRKALGYAINRQEIIETYLLNFGEACKGPVSPIFKKYLDDTLPEIEFNPAKAKDILKELGWEDKNKNGIIEKGDTEFTFDLYINSGNPRRSFAANVIKNNLRAIGVNVNIQILESQVFIQRLMNREFDAWLSGWTISLPLDIQPFWHSNPKIGIFNFSNYKNERIDNIFELLQNKPSDSMKIALYKELQSIIYFDQPVFNLYWVDNIIVYNDKLEDNRFSFLGLVKKAWTWKIKN